MQLPPPRATVWLIAATAAAHLVIALTRTTDQAALMGGFVAARFVGVQWLPFAVPAILTPLTATLIHANLLHILFNMLMLGFCGRFVEAALGPRGLLLLYGVGAYGAAAMQGLAGPTSLAPMIGASGAVSAVVGAYALLYGKQRTTGWGPIPARALHVLWLAAAWVGLQLLVGLATLPGVDGTVAIAAHIGGFLTGLAMARPLLLWRYRSA